MNREEAIQKALKLLKLSNSTNVHEAALAAQRAQEILLKFQISNEMLNEESSPEKDEPILDAKNDPLEQMNQRMIRWKSYLSGVIAKANSCRAYINGSNICLIGRPTDMQTVKYLYQMLCLDVDMLAKREGKGLGKTWANNFRYGVVDAIAEKLKEVKANVHKEMYQEAVDNCTAMIKIDNAIAVTQRKDREVEDWKNKNMRLRSTTTYIRSDLGARLAGKEAGKNILISSAKGALNNSCSKIQ